MFSAKWGPAIASQGWLYSDAVREPTLFENVTSEMTIAQEEIFGPVLALIKVDTLEQAIDLANDVQYG